MGVYLKRGKYFIDFYVDGKRVRECVGPVSRRDAEKALKSRQGDVVKGLYQLNKRAPSPLFCNFSEQFMEFSRAHKSSRSSTADETRLVHLKPFFGRYRLDQITSFLVEKYIIDRKRSITRRGKPPSPATINRELAVLRHMFNKAIDWGKAERNPVKGVRFLKEDPPKERILSHEEEQILLEHSAPHLRMAIILALNTGLRLGEILNLRWSDIDPIQGLLTVERGKGGKRRTVEMNIFLRESLKEFRETCQKSEYLFFNKRTGKPILDSKTAFRAAVRRSGIPHIRFHDLRHTFATRLLCRKVDLVTVQKLLGHSSIEMTMRYSHPGASERRKAVEMLSDGHHMDTKQEKKPTYGLVKSAANH